GQVGRCAGTPQRSVLRLRRRRREGAVGRPVTVPDLDALVRLLVGAAALLGRRPGGATPVERDPGGGRRGDRRAAGHAAGGDPPAGRTELHLPGGLRGTGYQRGQPAGIAPSGAFEGAGATGGVPGVG